MTKIKAQVEKIFSLKNYGRVYLLICRKLRYETDLAQNKSWKLRYDDLHIQDPSGTGEAQSQGVTTFKRNPSTVRQLPVKFLIL